MAWAPKVQVPAPAAEPWGSEPPAEPAPGAPWGAAPEPGEPDAAPWGTPPAEGGWAAPASPPAEDDAAAGWDTRAAAEQQGWNTPPPTESAWEGAPDPEIVHDGYAAETAAAEVSPEHVEPLEPEPGSEDAGGGMEIVSAADFMDRAAEVNTEAARAAALEAAEADEPAPPVAAVLALPGSQGGDEDLPVAVEDEPYEPPPPAAFAPSLVPPPPAGTHDTIRQEMLTPPPPVFAAPGAAAPAAALSPSPYASVPQGGPYIDGEHRVVLHTVQGQVRRGVVKDLDLGGDVVPLMPQPGARPDDVAFSGVKALFFMMAPGEKMPPQTGRKVKITFTDGRTVDGYFDEASETATGFFIIPLDARTNTKRIWIQRAAVRMMA